MLCLAKTLKLAPSEDRVAPRGKLLPDPCDDFGRASIACVAGFRSMSLPCWPLRAACAIFVVDRSIGSIDLHQAGTTAFQERIRARAWRAIIRFSSVLIT